MTQIGDRNFALKDAMVQLLDEECLPADQERTLRKLRETLVFVMAELAEVKLDLDRMRQLR